MDGGVGGRHSLRRMLEKSVGECYFVTLMVADAPQAADLDDDVDFFDTRLSYLSVSRHGHAKTAAVRASTSPVERPAVFVCSPTARPSAHDGGGQQTVWTRPRA
jgi:hypothetical protein